MRATALNAADASRPGIEMETEIGRLQGKWCGAEAITAGELVDVELDVGRPRYFSEFVVSPSPEAASGVIRGVIATVFEDDVIVLQIGSSAVQVEVEGGLPDDGLVGLTVGLAADDLEFHPSGV
ncbi:hypothetical protein IHE71_17550 [Myceligenerans sp. TRM 65318]|uniref:Uncharacterized protein n=2 Tax=Myceligenerans pegani TaxID=2776917 RepID=A0ABR9N2I0_9MICO|nr:hypothetical protein [Myceligenerans sp. TRM 65318]MBE1877496.1 hypothetical protein [Myceligenerans sp. TRM 65318]